LSVAKVLNNQNGSFFSFLLRSFSHFNQFNFLVEEGADNAGFEAPRTEDPAVWPSDSFLWIGESFVGCGSELRDAIDAFAAGAVVVGGVWATSAFTQVLHDHP
jgi:hypothetical protein